MLWKLVISLVGLLSVHGEVGSSETDDSKTLSPRPSWD